MVANLKGGDLHVVLLTPARRLADLHMDSVTLPTQMGEMEIRAGHAPAIVGLGEGKFVLKESVYAVLGGLAEVRDNCVTVFADAAEEAAGIDVARAERALKRARERLEAHGPDIDIERALRAEARAMARLQLAMARGGTE